MLRNDQIFIAKQTISAETRVIQMPFLLSSFHTKFAQLQFQIQARNWSSGCLKHPGKNLSLQDFIHHLVHNESQHIGVILFYFYTRKVDTNLIQPKNNAKIKACETTSLNSTK